MQLRWLARGHKDRVTQRHGAVEGLRERDGPDGGGQDDAAEGELPALGPAQDGTQPEPGDAREDAELCPLLVMNEAVPADGPTVAGDRNRLAWDTTFGRSLPRPIVLVCGLWRLNCLSASTGGASAR